MAVVTENFAAAQWGGARAALGKRIAQVSSLTASENAWHTIVGVVGNVRDDGVDASPPPIVFWPMVNHRSPQDIFVSRSMVFAVRTAGRAAAGLLPEVRGGVATVDPTLALGRVRTLDQVLRRSMARTSFVTVMLLIAAGMALSLGLVGIYGVVSYVARLRTREIGLRIALGADGMRVRRVVLGHGVRLALYGIGVGLVAALGITRVMSSLIHGVERNDPVTLGVVVGLLVGLTLLATYLPARRASRIDPMEALRAD